MFQSAQAYTLRKVGRFLPLNVCAFFCVMMHRKTYEAVGPMDEQFVPGFFEDDDYCLRIKALGLEVGCAEGCCDGSTVGWHEGQVDGWSLGRTVG